ncbi:GNAT family N-acetyltransferase [Egicoccus sp. AB-alg6-2]|uniref:GNAT family N-acetyltransferase n=1 Tax=Egicoccus sp. AB-alg6-2 TaxID=3242692 RepID=UPI00359E2B6C
MSEEATAGRLHVPDVLEGPTVRLRRFRPDDADALAAYRSDPDTARFQGWSTPFPLARARELVDEFAAGEPGRPGTTFQYAVERVEAAGLIGDVMLSTGDDLRLVEIGFTLAPEHRGAGHATAAIRLLLDHLFAAGSPVHRVEARLDPRNARSAALLDRLGFTCEGVLRESYWDDGGWTDDAVYGLLGREYTARTTSVEPRGLASPPSGRSDPTCHASHGPTA